jgi:hypothetical protein
LIEEPRIRVRRRGIMNQAIAIFIDADHDYLHDLLSIVGRRTTLIIVSMRRESDARVFPGRPAEKPGKKTPQTARGIRDGESRAKIGRTPPNFASLPAWRCGEPLSEAALLN